MKEPERIMLRIQYAKETDKLFSDNIPAYADWLEVRLAKLEAKNLPTDDVSNLFEFDKCPICRSKRIKRTTILIGGKHVYECLKCCEQFSN